ncbi:peptidase M48 Ste24p [Chloroherpeton thalassium ATCC 35110]|uniref:Peptidase M48 Ste24p n=1 Tax=Chloroherpeton thalassium (strain ATCC 35110 / GB-78) TaxID=517418 RepID=B3QUK9_CHLT3|nr:M48 family metallopeptidase [Chloroherpeton thalassium]ACF12915.1 peptidase M48 Ste24p [Chloroherpeton thalassium ATCC 35110]
MKKFITRVLILLVAVASVSSCKTVRKLASNNNVYSVQDDVQLGKEADAQIKADTKNYTFLKSSDPNYRQVNAYVDKVMRKILSANAVPYETEFNYNVQVLKNDVVNAFATAGGYLYFYYGLMKMLDNEAQLAGVVAHEMGHIAFRHATNEMTAQQITGGLVSLGLKIGGAGETAEQVAGLAYNLAFLKYGRDAEEEADRNGAAWMAKTDYNPYEMQGFFKKILDSDRSPEFLSTHPDPANRIKYIGEVLKKMGAKNSGKTYTAEYQAFKKQLY